MSAVFHVTMNYRLNQGKILLSPEAEDAANRRLLSQPEPEDTLPVPLSQYTEDKLRQQMKLYVPSFAKTFARIVTIFGATTLTTTTLLFALNEPR